MDMVCITVDTVELRGLFAHNCPSTSDNTTIIVGSMLTLGRLFKGRTNVPSGGAYRMTSKSNSSERRRKSLHTLGQDSSMQSSNSII